MKYLIIIIILILFIIVIAILKVYSLPSKIRKAEVFLEAEDYGKANEIVNKILEKNKDYAPAKYIRALILIKQTQYVLAINELNSIINTTEYAKYIKELDVHYHLSHLYNKIGNFSKEIDEYKIILTFNPNDLVANHRIGHAQYRQKDFRKAKDHLLKAILLSPTLTDIFLPLGISCYNISDYENGEAYLTKSLTIEGDHTEAEYFLGMIYKMKKDFDSAIRMFENAKKAKKYFSKSLHRLGEIFNEQEQFGKAIDYLEQGLNYLPEKTEDAYAYRYLLAECYEAENKINEAVHHWGKIATENPGFRSTKIKLESYKEILDNTNLMTFFIASLEELQPLIVEMISSLNYNIISKEKISSNEFQYKAYNIKRVNDPPILIYFNRSTKEVNEGNIIEFHKKVNTEKCKTGIYITTSKFSIRSKTAAQSKIIELFDGDFVNKTVEKIQARKKAK